MTTLTTALALFTAIIAYGFGYQRGADAVFDEWDKDVERQRAEKVIDLGSERRKRGRV